MHALRRLRGPSTALPRASRVASMSGSESPPAKRLRADGASSQSEAADELQLYSYWRSSCSYRVRIVLNLKKLAFEYRAVHLVTDGGQQLKDDYAALNPMREVPYLVAGDCGISQSQAIIEYLEEAHPEPPLMPADPLARARVREVCCIVSNDIQPVGNLRVLNRVADTAAKDGDAAAKGAIKGDWARHFISLGFSGLEALLSRPGYAGKYCVGDAVTIADAFLVPQVYNAVRWKVDMAPYPTIQRVYDALLQLPEVQAAQPSAQPDAEKE